MHISGYSVANGLPSNEVRNVALDSLGFAWIATDAGLIRFDGTQFEDFSQYVPSKYGKQLLTIDRGLLLSHDAGISLIQPELDTTKITLFQRASINPQDSLLYYPYRMFRRADGDILVAQPGGQVHRVSSEGLELMLSKTTENPSPDVELFFGEVEGHLFIGYSDGSLYSYDDQSEKLNLVASYPAIFDLKTSGNTIWIASDKIYRVRISSKGKLVNTDEVIGSVPGEVTALALDKDENIYVGISDSGLYYLSRTKGKKAEFIKVFSNNDPHSLHELPFRNVHDIVFDADNRLWVCSSEGLGILQKRFFESIGSIPNANTTAISIADNGKIFVNFGDIYRIERTNYGYDGEQLSTSSLGTITALTTKGNRLWTGTSTGMLFELDQQGKQIRAIDLEERGEGIFFLAGDGRNRLWVAQAPRDRPIMGIGCVLPDGSFKDYGIEQGLTNRIICLKETQKGRIYASGIGKETYLYRYFPEKDRFINLSLPFDFYVGPNFQVHDFTIDQNGVIWLASTDGLLRYDMDRVTKIDLGPGYSSKELKAVAHAADGSIWVSFDTEGVVRYDDGNIIIMKEESGLPSKVMTYRCMHADKEGRLWIGTAEGLVYSLVASPKPGQSDKPLLLSTAVDGKTTVTEDLRIYPDQSIRIRYTAPSFHGFRTFYQYQIDDAPWSSPTTETTIDLTGIGAGRHVLAVRAKREGAYYWSEPALHIFTVRDFWFKNKILIWVLALLLLAITTYIFWSQKRRFKLVLNSLTQGLEAKEEEVHKQEADLVRVREEMKVKQREKRANLLVLEIMHRAISKIGPATKWELVLETLSLDLIRLPGVVAFEIGVHRGKNIEFEGYSEKVRGFTSAKVPFDPATSLASYCIAHAKAFIFNRLAENSTALLDKKDKRIGGYKAALSVPFYIDNREAILTVYADQEDLFDEYTRKTFQIFATYLEQII